jgi:outer membrane protein assembly factor BamB
MTYCVRTERHICPHIGSGRNTTRGLHGFNILLGGRIDRLLRRIMIGLITGATAVLLSACGAMNPFATSDSNVVPPEPLTEITPSAEIVTVWNRNVGASAGRRYLRLRPAVEGNTVFAAEPDGDVTAIDLKTGDELWQSDTDSTISGGPGVGDGMVVVGTNNGDVIALKAETGELAWRQRVSSEVLAAPAIGAGVVVVRTQDGKIVGLAINDGTRLWVYDRAVPALSLRGTSAPVIANDNTVLAGFDSGLLVALAIADGQLLWESRIATPSGRSELERLVDIDADPVVAGDIAFVVTFQGRVAAVQITDGNVEWRRDMSSHAGLGLATDALLITDAESLVWAIDRDTSASIWRQDKLARRSLTPPTQFGDHVVVGDFEGYVHFLDQSDGRIAARLQIDSDGLIASPVVADDLLLFYGRGGTLTALRTQQ